MTKKTYTIDAAGKVFGRLASEVAAHLSGKKKVDYTPHLDPMVFVVVTNLLRIGFTGTKMQTKLYQTHTGHPGGFREVTLERAWKAKPAFVFTRTVGKMLARNRRRKTLLRRLKVVL